MRAWPRASDRSTGAGFIQGYNAQLAVDAEAQIIIAQHVTAATPDVQQLRPLVTAITAGLRRKPAQVLADAGYWSGANVDALVRQEHRAVHRDGAAQAQRAGAGGPAGPASRGHCAGR